MSTELRLEHVSKTFGNVEAVRDVSLVIEPGTVAGLIGPNGAGKTTLFNLVTRVLEPTTGRIRVGERDVKGLSLPECAKLGVARTFQTPRGFPSLSVLENVEVMLSRPRETVFGALFRRRRASEVGAVAREALSRVGLEELSRYSYASLSIGEQRLLEIARQIVVGPKLLLLDEPTAGLDARYQDKLRSLVYMLQGEGQTIVIVEHNLHFLLRTVSTVHVMKSGTLLRSGTPREIAADEDILAAYQGRR